MRSIFFVRRVGVLLLLTFSASIPALGVEVIGIFTETNGDVIFLRDDLYYQAADGVEVQARDLVETADAGTAQIEMVDGSILRLGPDSRVLLSEYRVSSTKSVIAASLDVLTGWLRFAVVKLKSEATYQFDTPVLTIGIRGTEGVIEARNDRGSLLLEEGQVQVDARAEALAEIPALRVTAGQWVQRRRGQSFRRPPRVPRDFRARMPATVRGPVSRRAARLARRGVTPRALRRATEDDIRQYLRQHAPMREKLERRLRPSQRPDERSRSAPVEPAGDRRPRPNRRATGPGTRQRQAVDRLIGTTSAGRYKAGADARRTQPTASRRRQRPSRREPAPSYRPQRVPAGHARRGTAPARSGRRGGAPRHR